MLSSRLEAKKLEAIYPPTNTREGSCKRAVLDAKFLLEKCYVFTPEDLYEANVSGKELLDVSF